MFFTKYPYRRNFSFASSYDGETGRLNVGNKELTLFIDHFEGGVYRLSYYSTKLWKPTRRIVELEAPSESKSEQGLKVGKDGNVSLLNESGQVVLEMLDGQGFGVCGEKSMFQFLAPKGARYYGMGEKTFGRLELSGLRSKYWNTDVWSDFHWGQWKDQPTDPPYASVPYLIVRNGDDWVGLLLDNPYPAYMETPGREGFDEAFVEWQRTAPHVILGNEGGEPTLWIIHGKSLKELTQKLQKLVGTTPLPPLWSLGYHQSRWGYAGEKDLLELDSKFNEHKIPCDGLWLDIDYMDGFRLFTIGDGLFPEGLQATAAKLAKNRRKMVPIFDPGLKQDPAYAAYQDGKSKNIFCKNPEGEEFIGLVWPGETVFPDFTLDKARKWWTGQVKDFVKNAFWGCWVDMNDPSTGPVDPYGMLFNNGKEPHAAHRNHYALGMQKATLDGFLKAHPGRRPFMLSRSAFTGTSRYSAVWTGDNVSNYFYLRIGIPTSLNLSLSGIPFNGPDVGGFGDDTNEQLMLDWVKCCFLFPFMRNHSMKGARDQEPWAFSGSALGVIKRYIQLRYKMLPYLYNLFMEQEEKGDSILRPVIYEFTGLGEGYDNLSDQFMVGQAIMQAPVVSEEERSRDVLLPGRDAWFEDSGHWRSPGKERVSPERGDTPLYFRMGSIVPMQRGIPKDNRKELKKIEAFVFIKSDWTGSSEYTYRADDGETFGYKNGKRSSVQITAAAKGGVLELTTQQTADGFGPIEIEFVLVDEFKSVTLNGKPCEVAVDRGQFTGHPFTAYRVKA